MRTVLILLGLLLAHPVWAVEWTRFYKNNEIAQYVDYESIRKTSNGRRMWILSDYKSAQTYYLRGGFKYLSDARLDEFDCVGERRRLLSVYYYSGVMGNGAVLWTESPQNEPWDYIALGSDSAREMKIACGYRLER